MTDWNKYAQPAATNTATPTTGTSSGATDWSKYSTPTVANTAPVQPAAQDQSLLDKAKSVGTAAIAGASNAGANIAETAGDAGTWLLNKIGAIDSKTKESMDKYINSAVKGSRVEGNPNGNVFEKAVAAHPAVAGVSQAVPEVAGIVGLMPGPTKLTGILPKAVNIAAQAGVGALTNAGLAGGQGQQAQDNAALIGAVVPTAVSAVGAAVKAGANYLTRSSALKDALQTSVKAANEDLLANSSLNSTDRVAQSIGNFIPKVKEIENANYNQIKAITGTIDNAPIAKSVNGILSKPAGLDPKQISILNNISDQSGKLANMSDAIELKKLLSSNNKYFMNTPAFKELTNSVDSAIGKKAADAGLGNDWQLAKKFHSDVVAPLQDFGADDIAAAVAQKDKNPSQYADAVRGLITRGLKSPQEMKALLNAMGSDGSKIMEQSIVKNIFDDINVNPDNFKPNSALIKLNKAINTFSGTLSKDSIDTLKGIKSVMQKSGVKATSAISESNTYAQHVIGGGLGGVLGSIAGPAGAAAGGMAGVAIAPQIANLLSGLIESPTGIKILKGIGEGKPWVSTIGKFLKSAPAISQLPGQNENRK